eukprot:403375034
MNLSPNNPQTDDQNQFIPAQAYQPSTMPVQQQQQPVYQGNYTPVNNMNVLPQQQTQIHPSSQSTNNNINKFNSNHNIKCNHSNKL